MSVNTEKNDSKPISLQLGQFLIYLQMVLQGFIVILSVLFMIIPGESGSGWGNFRANVLKAAFGISPQEYDAMHLTYLAGLALLIFIVLLLLQWGIRKRIFLLCLILAIVLVVLNLGNPLAIFLSLLILLFLTASSKTRKYLNIQVNQKVGQKD